LAAQAFSVVCAWCNRTVQAAPAGSRITHTICQACVDWTLTQSAGSDAHVPPNVDYVELPPRSRADPHLSAESFELELEHEIATFLKH
jgi:hypothetical protein